MKPLLLLLALGLPAAGPPLKPDRNGDYLPAIQAAVDAGQALSAADHDAGFTVDLPQTAKGYGVSGPVYVDGQNIAVKGDGPGSRLFGLNYGGPPLVIGVGRLADPGRYRVTSVLGTGRSGLATRGDAAFQVTQHPLQTGAGAIPSDPTPDYWRGDVYCWEFALARPSPWAPGDHLFGLTNDGNGVPGPWQFRAGREPGTLELWFRTADQGERYFRRAAFPTPGPGPWRVTVRWDGRAASVRAWVDGAARPVTLGSEDATPFVAGSKLARHDGATPFVFGSNGGGRFTAAELHGLAVTRGAKYLDADTLIRSDGQPVNDSRFWESLNDWTGYGVQTVASLPMDDAPATHAAVNSPTGRGVGFWVPAKPVPAGNVRVSDLSVRSDLQQAVAVGYVFGAYFTDVDAQGRSQGVGSVPVGCSYPVVLTRCRLGGYGAAYYGWEQILRATDTEFTLSGRDGALCQGGDFLWRSSLFTFNLRTESFFRTIGQGYGGVLTVDEAQIDNESGGDGLVAVVDVDHSPYSANRVTLKGITTSTVGARTAFVRVKGRRTGDPGTIYTPGKLSISDLSVYGGMPPGAAAVRIDGRGSWYGTFDGAGLGSAAVAGDGTDDLKVVPPVVPVAAP